MSPPTLHLPSPQAILEIQLSENVSALGLQALLGVANTLYGTHEWLKFAEDSAGNEPVPDLDFTPLAPALLISRLEIGTPNLLTFLGSPEGLTFVASVLTMLGGFTTAATMAYKNLWDARKSKSDIARNAAAAAKDVAEAQHIDVRTKLANAELTDKLSANAALLEKLKTAKELNSQGKISQRAFEEKSAVPTVVAHNWILAAPIVKSQSFVVKSV